MTLVLLDADIVAYRCAASAENEPQEVAEVRVNDLVNRILYETTSSNYVGYLTGSNNFRYAIYPEYKANRRGKPKPKHLEACRELLITQWKCKVTDGIEADDALGIEHQANEGAILASIDKDLLQLPGRHYNFVKQEWKEISSLDGLRNFYVQLLEGDASDNIPAFDGKLRTTRPKFVQKLLDPLYEMTAEVDMFSYVMAVYGSHHSLKTWEFYLPIVKLHAQLLYIHKKEGDMWIAPLTMENGPPPDSEDSSDQSLEVEHSGGHRNIAV